MWIIPKNLPIFRSAQDTEGLTSDLNELSEQLEQSVLWRSKPSSSKTWLRRLKRDSLTLRLFSQTLKPSLGNHSVEKWTSSVEASLVNHLVQQEIEKETKTQDTSSPSLSMESNGLESLPLFSWKMSKESCQASSKETIGQTQKGHLFCSMSLENWKGWVTKQRQGYSQRVKSVLPTNENECLYLVSEMTSDKVELIISTDSLTRAWWATPRANKTGSESKEKWEIRCKKFGQKLSIPLGLQVEIEESHTQQEEEKSSTGTNQLELPWATPTTRDWKGKYSKGVQENPMKLTRNLLPDQAHCGTYRGKLNPRWVEMLMGVPIGWTMPSCTTPVTVEQMSLGCLGTELCQILQQEPSLPCGKNLTNLSEKDSSNPEKPKGLWSTPPASQRGEGLDNYLSRMRNRFQRGFDVAFAPTLQIQVEAEEKDVDIKGEVNSMKRTEKILKQYPSANKEALILPDNYDHCILGVENGVYAYSHSCVIDVLVQENVDAINNGVFDLYNEGDTPEESAHIYAIEMFDYNMDIKGENYPVFKYDKLIDDGEFDDGNDSD